MPHQANLRIIVAACQRLGIPEERTVVVIDRYGNTSSASIPLALHDAITNDRVHDGDNLLLDRVRWGHDLGQRRSALGGVSAPPTKPPLVILAAGRARRYGGCKPLAPVGPRGEAVIDLVASDALAAGSAPSCSVLGPATGPAIRYHVERTWPSHVDVRFALQEAPLGTVHAVLQRLRLRRWRALRRGRTPTTSTAGPPASLLAAHLQGPDPTNALVGFRLADAVIGHAPVTRGICQVGTDGQLLGVVNGAR